MRAKLQAIKQELRAAQAPADPGPGEMAETGRQGLLQLSRPCRPTVGRWLHSASSSPNSGSDRSGDAVRKTARRGSRSRSWPKIGSRKPDTLHPWPRIRFAVTHPRWEPYAGKPHVRFLCGGRSAMSVPTAIASLAMTIENCARGLGWEAARALRGGEGGCSSFHPASACECLTPVEHEQDQAERQQDRASDHLQFGVGRRLRQLDRVGRRRDHRERGV